jgi:hypothetical protein
MKKFLIGVALVTSISSTALASETKTVAKDENKLSVLSKINLALVTDTEHNTTEDTTTTKFGALANVRGFDLSLRPRWSWDNDEINNVELTAGYNFEVTNGFSVKPYGEINFDNDLDTKNKIVGLKTKYKF